MIIYSVDAAFVILARVHWFVPVSKQITLQQAKTSMKHSNEFNNVNNYTSLCATSVQLVATLNSLPFAPQRYSGNHIEVEENYGFATHLS